MILTLIKAFGMILAAELGDKTQFLAIGFATKYKIRDVLIGIGIGAFLNHFLAVLIGLQIKSWVDVGILGLVSGLIFIMFSWYTLLPDDGNEKQKPVKYGAIITVALAFFLGELGDKTQIAVVVLSIDSGYPILTLIGAVLGMIVIGYLGILIGIKLGDKIPELYMKIASSLLFGIVGSFKLFDSLTLGDYGIYILTVYVIIYIGISLFLIRRRVHHNKVHQSQLKKQSEELHEYYRFIKKRLDSLCLNCVTCDSSMCLLGYSKEIIYKAINDKDIDYEELHSKLIKNYDKKKLIEAYNELVDILKETWDNQALQHIRSIFEVILYDKEIEAKDFNTLTNKIRTMEV